MKRYIAQRLRRMADRLDPPPTPTPRPVTAVWVNGWPVTMNTTETRR